MRAALAARSPVDCGAVVVAAVGLREPGVQAHAECDGHRPLAVPNLRLDGGRGIQRGWRIFEHRHHAVTEQLHPHGRPALRSPTCTAHRGAPRPTHLLRPGLPKGACCSRRSVKRKVNVPEGSPPLATRTA